MVEVVHRTLRTLILKNELAAGTTLPQARLASEMGLSRGPVREALRMLQEEGLVTARLNHRPRVASINPDDLDSIYAQRILIDSTGIRLTVPRLTVDELRTAEESLRAIDRVKQDLDAYRESHKVFHATITSRLPSGLKKVANRLFDQSERYRCYNAYLVDVSSVFATAKHEHIGILQACRVGDSTQAGILLAHHYQRTVKSLLYKIHAEYEPTAVEAAVSILERSP